VFALPELPGPYELQALFVPTVLTRLLNVNVPDEILPPLFWDSELRSANAPVIVKQLTAPTTVRLSNTFFRCHIVGRLPE
jgi:hypothetical protein